MRRLINYFRDLRQQDFPDSADEDAWNRLLVNTEIMVEDRGRAMASAEGLLLFGKNPSRYLAADAARSAGSTPWRRYGRQS